MCLYFINKEHTKGVPKPLIAEEDIVCYKMAKIYIDSKTRIDEETGLEVDDSKIYTYTPYKEYNLIPGKKIVDKHQTNIESGIISNSWIVGGGMFHTFARPPYIHGDIRGEWDVEYKIVLYAIIPKGAKYYEGTFGVNDAYASKELIITKNVADIIDCEVFSEEFPYEYKHKDLIYKTFNVPLDKNGYVDKSKMIGLKVEDLDDDKN